MAKSNYSILLDAELNLKSLEDQLKKAQKEYNKYKLGLDASGLKESVKQAKESAQSAEEFGLKWQEAGELLNKVKDVISSMVSEVFELDAALIEFQKVSDLSGASLDNYLEKLRDLGSDVARTGQLWAGVMG